MHGDENVDAEEEDGNDDIRKDGKGSEKLRKINIRTWMTCTINYSTELPVFFCCDQENDNVNA